MNREMKIVFHEGELKRKCGTCQLCCKLLPLPGDNRKSVSAMLSMIEAGKATPDEFKGMVPEFQKPANERCQHQKHGKGCGIYQTRPFSCRMWYCRWLVDDAGDTPRPDHAHYVIDFMPDIIRVVAEGEEPVELLALQIWIDPKYPDAHRDPALRAYIAKMGKEGGYAALIRYSSSDALALIPPSMTHDGEWYERRGPATYGYNSL